MVLQQRLFTGVELPISAGLLGDVKMSLQCFGELLYEPSEVLIFVSCPELS